MTNDQKGDHFEVHIGSVSGPVHTGKGDILVEQWQANMTRGEALEAAHQLFAELRAQMAEQAPPEMEEEAKAKVDALEEAVTAKTPDLEKMARIREWFVKHLPSAVGTVTSVLVNPILGKVVEAAGDLAAEQLRQRFSSPENSP